MMEESVRHVVQASITASEMATKLVLTVQDWTLYANHAQVLINAILVQVIGIIMALLV